MSTMGEQRAISEDAPSWRNGINRLIGELAGQLKTLTQMQESMHQDIQVMRKDIGDIKEKLGMVRGKMAVWGALGGAAVSLIAQLILNYLRR